MEPDILDQLRDLIEQATKERSHYYVRKCAENAFNEITALRIKITQAKRILS